MADVPLTSESAVDFKYLHCSETECDMATSPVAMPEGYRTPSPPVDDRKKRSKTYDRGTPSPSSDDDCKPTRFAGLDRGYTLLRAITAKIKRDKKNEYEWLSPTREFQEYFIGYLMMQIRGSFNRGAEDAYLKGHFVVTFADLVPHLISSLDISDDHIERGNGFIAKTSKYGLSLSSSTILQLYSAIIGETYVILTAGCQVHLAVIIQERILEAFFNEK
jgi:hypothetical protein